MSATASVSSAKSVFQWKKISRPDKMATKILFRRHLRPKITIVHKTNSMHSKTSKMIPQLLLPQGWIHFRKNDDTSEQDDMKNRTQHRRHTHTQSFTRIATRFCNMKKICCWCTTLTFIWILLLRITKVNANLLQKHLKNLLFVFRPHTILVL